MTIEEFLGTRPELLPEVFFDGRLEGWAVIESLIGNLQKRATLSAEGTWDSGSHEIRFTETCRFDDGHTDTLAWTIRKLGAGVYQGSELRIEGMAKGKQAGCAFNWRYTRDTPQGGGHSTLLNFDDWFYMIDARACMVRGSAGRVGSRHLSQGVINERKAFSGRVIVCRDD